MLEAALQKAATDILETAIRIAPRDVREWGAAMLGELRYVDGGWAAVAWALGGAGVLAKHAIVSLLIPGRRGHGLLPDGGLFTRNVSMRNAALAASSVLILGALLFFAAPPFRQGLRVSLASWNSLFQITVRTGQQPRLQALARSAKARHDAEGLVFVAARLWNASESARLAEEAVRINPKLIWAYAIVAVRHPGLPQVPQWLPKLERWQPQNSLFHFIAAESIDIARVSNPSMLSPAKRQMGRDSDPVWQKSMAAAFASPEFDDYTDRLQDLGRRVAREYGINEPGLLLLQEESSLPSFALSDARLYAESLVKSGEALEARGDWAEATGKYWIVARFGQVMDSGARGNYERWAAANLQAMAYKHLQAVSAKQGNAKEAALFAYLGTRFSRATAARESFRDGVFGWYTARRNAAVLQISSLLMLIFAGLLIIAASILIAGGIRREVPRRSRTGVMVLALASAAGLLLSSATLYLTYRPYWYMLQDAFLKGQFAPAGQMADLHSFLMSTRALPVIRLHPGQALFLPLYLWTAVIFAGIAGIAFIFLRHVPGKSQLGPAQPDPHMQ